MSIWEFENVTYPRLWHIAFDAGRKASEDGLPRECNMTRAIYLEHVLENGNILKVYKSAWEQGWDNDKIPSVFTQMENLLKQMPTEPYYE